MQHKGNIALLYSLYQAVLNSSRIITISEESLDVSVSITVYHFILTTMVTSQGDVFK